MRDRRQQFLCIGILRIAQDLFGRALLDDPSRPHHDDTITQQAHHIQIMRDEQIAHAHRRLQILQQVQDHRLHGNVERRGRLVENDELWMQRDRARDADAGLLAARQLMREAIQQIDRQADQAGKFLAAGAQRIAALDVAELHDRIGDGARRGEARIEAVGRILEHHLDALAQRQPRKGTAAGYRRSPRRRTRYGRRSGPTAASPSSRWSICRSRICRRVRRSRHGRR